MRDLIMRRLAACTPSRDPRERALANVEGAASDALLELLAQPGHEASVLLGLVDRPAGLTVLFTERALHLQHHPGQISFPGGRLVGREDPVAAALREASEEIGLPPEHVAVAGCLDVHLTGTGFAVTPVVGFVRQEFEPAPDPAEVASVFEVPLDYILDLGNTRMVRRERFGTRFRVHELEYGGRLIWGATATMLVTFRDLLLAEESNKK